MKHQKSIPIILTTLSTLCAVSSAMAASDATAYINGNIYTANTQHEFATSVVVENGVFKYVGNDVKTATSFNKDIKVVDLKGKTVVPGLYDSHIHPIGAGEKLLFECHLPASASAEEVINLVAECVDTMPAGSWIIGSGWGSDILMSDDIPTIKMLDDVSKDRAILLTDYSHHNVWVNSKAIAESKITLDSMEQYKDLVIYDNTGAFSGFFLEGAGGPLHDAVPKRTSEEYALSAKKVITELNKMGIIGVKDSYVFDKEYNAWKQLDDDGSLTANVALSWGWPTSSNMSQDEKQKAFMDMVKPSSGHLYSKFAKITLDGIPPTKTAAMLAPYSDDEKEALGKLNYSETLLATNLMWLDKHGFTTQVHAVGDRAARTMLNAVEKVRDIQGDSGLRHEIAHACIVDPSDIKRFSELNVVPNFSPIFWYPSMFQDGLEMAIGKERAGRNCAVKTLSENGSMPTGGSDWPISPDVNPWKAMESLITRKDPNGLRADETVWPEQKINIVQALELYTINGAKAQRRGDRAGSIETGKSADMLLLNQNVFEVDSSAIGETKVDQTVFEGKTIYTSPESQVRTTIEKYSASVFNADTTSLKQVFHANAVMAGDLPHVHLAGTPEPFIKDVASRPSMASQNINLISEITYIDVQGDTASVTLEEENFFGHGRFVNYLSLVKENNQWKIVSKVFTHK
ncbi:Amidohydro_3 domain-containing protein [Vibrio chagasii]|uniref:amidohydrolase family protein n=1 Tax=Vibrio chagasii TaxID=170679 RepID=UPI001EFE250A|nr:amidohydrolase family protein [Vibrio chagasii]MDE9380719.1 amidohydrolase family protein [Vibrio alginolyticus]MCG9607248.1 amidohydrolase family protein [Vibrio chagasii]CAH7049427.1 Amidohydro_3 domain-containing protein [Vibrio chagasii]CAH7065622.1 Amidohydro_3 domain-containing protein [Vibrio chagasii]CAH7187682.1 Amidohydro_3 domain-containing protein [Vibrio chagasii]